MNRVTTQGPVAQTRIVAAPLAMRRSHGSEEPSRGDQPGQCQRATHRMWIWWFGLFRPAATLQPVGALVAVRAVVGAMSTDTSRP